MSVQTPDSSSPGISYDGDMIFVNKMKNKNMSPEEFQRQIYYNVLHFFRAETPEISSSRILFIQDLKKALKLSKENHFTFEEKLKTEPLVKRWRNASKASDNKEGEITAVQGHPLSKSSIGERVSPEHNLRCSKNVKMAEA